MNSISLNGVGPLRAAELNLFARNEATRELNTRTVTVEVVRPVDAQTKLKADADVMQVVPTTESVRLDIRV